MVTVGVFPHLPALWSFSNCLHFPKHFSHIFCPLGDAVQPNRVNTTSSDAHAHPQSPEQHTLANHLQ